MAGSFLATLKTEFYYRRVWPTKKAARRTPVDPADLAPAPR